MPHLINAQLIKYSDEHVVYLNVITPCGIWVNVKNVYLHMPFITIIGVIKVVHLWARCNVALAFLWTTAPLVFRILDSRPAVTLILVTPSTPLPCPEQHYTSSPMCKVTSLYLWFTFISLGSIYLLGHFTFGTHFEGNHNPLLYLGFYAELHSNKVH